MAKRKEGQMGGADETREGPSHGDSMGNARASISGAHIEGQTATGRQSGHPGGSYSPDGTEKPGRVETGYHGGDRYSQAFAEGSTKDGEYKMPKDGGAVPPAEYPEGDGSTLEHHGSKPEHSMKLPPPPHSPTPGADVGTNTSRDLAAKLPELKDDHSKYDGITEHGLQMAEAPPMKQNTGHNIAPDGGNITYPKEGGNTTPAVRDSDFTPKAKEYLKGIKGPA